MDEKLDKLLEVGFAFHGHRCPAMPLGIRSALVAMDRLGVGHCADKELHVIAETGKGHAAGCFLDGIMVATGCTYGKSNIEKRYWNKMAFTLVDTKTDRAVRVSLAPGFFAKMLQSPFVQKRRDGVPPQDVDPALLEPLLDNILGLDMSQALNISDIFSYHVDKPRSCFDAVPCAECGELVFENAARLRGGQPVCQGCFEK